MSKASANYTNRCKTLKTMFPIDEEFSLMYFLFGITLIYIIVGLTKSKRKLFYRLNLVLFIIYSFNTFYSFLDLNNFKGGGSLVVLMMGLIPVVSHISGLFLIEIIRPLFKKRFTTHV
jgi:hypothetical protein